MDGFVLGCDALIAALVLALSIAIAHVGKSYLHWRTHFDKERRRPRSHRNCPSHKRAPVRRRRRTSEVADHCAESFRTSLTALTELLDSSKSPSAALGRGSSLGSVSTCPSASASEADRPSSVSVDRRALFTRQHSSFSVSKADRLDMDHIYLSFPCFLWGMCFIWPAVVFKSMVGIITLMARERLCRLGLIRPAPFDPEYVCYDVCLNSTLAIYFDSFDEDGNVVCQFDNVPIINNKGNIEIKSLLELRLDVKIKRFVSAKADSEVLSASEALNLIFFYLVSAHHTKIHSLANWAVVPPESTRSSSKERDFVIRNGIVTVMYNYFGYSGFKDLFPQFKSLGLLSPCVDGGTLAEVFDYGIKAGIPEHSKIRELARYSPFVDFIMNVRPIFMCEFVKHKHSFPGCNIEALFAGTVLHSLDHSTAGWNVKDPLWFDTGCPKFGLMAEVNRIVRVGFIEDLVGLAFHKSFRNSGHPFYEAVYKKAAAINQLYADHMDTCIIK